jgi:hypothetical protein
MAKRLIRDSRPSLSGERANRAMRDRAITSNRNVTDAERLTMFRQTMFQSALPDLPKIQGYHVCWLTTTNPGDSVESRLRLGYEPITPEDIPGWEHSTLKSGNWEGCIGVNEMVAFKLPSHLYQEYMRIAHHEQPQEQQEMLEANALSVAEQAKKTAKRHKGVKFFRGNGNTELAEEDPPVPDFSEFGELTD